jgi:flagellar motor switch/type III secretory pathway protein FliN
MTIAPRAWLPANALRDNALVHALSAFSERWAGRWFAAPKPTNVRMHDVAERAGIAAGCECWIHPDAGMMLALGPSAHLPLAGAMLGIDTVTQKLTAEDHAVLRRLAKACASDYLHGAAAALGFQAASTPSSSREAPAGLRFALSLGAATQVIELHFDHRAALAARRNILAEAPTPSPPLASRNEAIGRQPIDVGAMIGTGRLGLGELRTLACGDVLVLDRGPGDAMAIAVNGIAHPEAPCSIVEERGALCMRLNGSNHGDCA